MQYSTLLLVMMIVKTPGSLEKVNYGEIMKTMKVFKL